MTVYNTSETSRIFFKMGIRTVFISYTEEFCGIMEFYKNLDHLPITLLNHSYLPMRFTGRSAQLYFVPNIPSLLHSPLFPKTDGETRRSLSYHT
jgi:hypothetical protein